MRLRGITRVTQGLIANFKGIARVTKGMLDDVFNAGGQEPTAGPFEKKFPIIGIRAFSFKKVWEIIGIRAFCLEKVISIIGKKLKTFEKDYRIHGARDFALLFEFIIKGKRERPLCKDVDLTGVINKRLEFGFLYNIEGIRSYSLNLSKDLQGRRSEKFTNRLLTIGQRNTAPIMVALSDML